MSAWWSTAISSDVEAKLADVGARCPLRLMRSDGGVATPRAARANPAHMMLSGPAAGVIAGRELGRRLGRRDLVTFDMGGTSADFSVIAEGEPRTVRERAIGGQPLRLTSLDIETISAGGGSIAWVDRAGALKVGPDSAGAVPGPACYGQGGSQPTVSDAAVLLGLLDPERYLGGRIQPRCGSCRRRGPRGRRPAAGPRVWRRRPRASSPSPMSR